MKLITNWRNATVADIESDGLLNEATKIHVLSYKLFDKDVGSIEGSNKERLIKFFNYHIDNRLPVVMHNGICFDSPLAEKILGVDLSKLMVIDTLGISWYLNTNRPKHGLDSFLEDYGIAKPKVEDWSNLTYEEYKHRCEEDVKINTALWEDFQSRLFDMYWKAKKAIDSGDADCKRIKGEECYLDSLKNTLTVDQHIDRILTFICHKVYIARLKEKTRFKLDEDLNNENILKLEALIKAAADELESVMPKVAKYTTKNLPAKMFKKNGDISATGISWNETKEKIGKKDELGNDIAVWVDSTTIKVLNKYEDPNINSSQQIKDFLFSKGWKPQTFKFDVDEEAKAIWAANRYRKDLKPVPRKIPQLNIEGENGKELCPSVLMLADEVPEIMAYAKYSVIKHRYGILTGFKRDAVDGWVKGRVRGFTNTLREQHTELTNLPSVGKPYGDFIRGALIAESGNILCGSDMSSLEDRVKHHFMIPHDPEYVSTMMDANYDPHVTTALFAGMITKEEFDQFMQGNKTDKVKTARKAGKVTNYAAVYGSGAETLARSSGLSVAECKTLLEGYWKLNWSVEAIADEQCVIECDKGLKWLVNPLNGFLYNIRSDKDRFSTLCQGTGSYLFDMWVDKFLTKMEETWGVKKLTFTAHDELVISFRDNQTNSSKVKQLLKLAVQEVNVEYKLRRELDVDVQFGYRYSDIH